MRHTDMNYVTLTVYHDVAIMPILDLQDVTCDGVRGHRLNKVKSCLLELYSIRVAIFCNVGTTSITPHYGGFV